METDATLRISFLDRMHDGLFIFFNDGKKGFYSADLLHSFLASAGRVENREFLKESTKDAER
jgi:hypothetical protein